ncbi:MAG TPA: amino acid ABC transporter permease [Candidatus Limnocylindria bacterium]|nr:amino acid ABC transporter permease [Candidatus Limnocylindria bacterium]
MSQAGGAHAESTSLIGPGDIDPIVEQIADARRMDRWRRRAIFIVVWVVLVGGLGWFLWNAGNVEWDFIVHSGPYIIGGVWITILVSILSIALGTSLAIVGALGRLSANPVIYAVASLYVSLVRGTPLLVQIFFVFYALPQAGIVLPPIPTGVLALGFNYGAYMTEIFRAGIQAVPRGQSEAAKALGMQESQIFRRIVLPQAVRIVTPAVGNEFIAMIKDSSLVSTITVQELLWRAETAGRAEFQTIPAFLIAALAYWILTIVFSLFQERLERRLARSDR